jgi:sec-independent protein translocase protein TatB
MREEALVFDIGMGEFLVIALVAVLILGPDRLPKAIAEGSRWLRALRDQAANARREIVNAADLDPAMTDDLRKTMSDLSELHPRRLASSILSDANPLSASEPAAPSSAAPAAPAPPSRPASSPAAAPAPAPRPSSSTAFDPDAT